MPSSNFGGLLKSMRAQRRVSQQQLAIDAEVSARHVSFLETGRAQPSREMVLLLGSALEMPLRDRNLLLELAGFASVYRQTALDAPEMAELRQALELILRAHEPFPAVVLDRDWNVVVANAGFTRVHALMTSTAPLRAYAMLPQPRPNLVRVLARDYRPAIRNWERVILDTLPRLEREAAGNPAVRALVDELRALPGIPKERDLLPRAPLVLPIEFAIGEQSARMFSTLTTLGTPLDVTTEELRIELLHPADAASRALLAPLLQG